LQAEECIYKVFGTLWGVVFRQYPASTLGSGVCGLREGATAKEIFERMVRR